MLKGVNEQGWLHFQKWMSCEPYKSSKCNVAIYIYIFWIICPIQNRNHETPYITILTNHLRHLDDLCGVMGVEPTSLIHTLQHPFAPPHPPAPLCCSTPFSTPLLLHTLQYPFAASHTSAPLCSSTHFSTPLLLRTLQHPFAPPHTSAPLCSSTHFSTPLFIHNQAHFISSSSAVLWAPFFSVPLSSSSRASNLTILASTSSNACTCEDQCIQVIIVPAVNWK